MRLPSFSLLVTLVAVLLSLAHDFGLAAANGKKRSGSKLMKNLEKAEKNAQGKPVSLFPSQHLVPSLTPLFMPQG